MIKRQAHYLKSAFFLIFLITLSSVICHLSPCYAETVSSKELIERAKELDGKEITYKGEAVTAILNRGEYSWINLNDGNNAISVWCKSANLAPVKFIGGYKVKGDTLEVVGKFNRACHSHNGEMDIHAKDVNIIETGRILAEQPSKKKLILSGLIFSMVLLLAIIFRKRI